MKTDEAIASCVECPRCNGGRLRLLEGICNLCKSLGGILALVLMLSGCSLFAKPSKARLKVLLGECRVHEREYARLDKERKKAAEEAARPASAPKEPAQAYGSIGFGEAGH